MLVTNTGFIQGPLLATRPTYDPEADFEPISQHNLAPTVFVINPALRTAVNGHSGSPLTALRCSGHQSVCPEASI